jgi:hypothetical protein
MDAPRDLPELVNHRDEIVCDVGKLLPWAAGRGAGCRLARLERQRDEPLLDAVVEVALDPAPGCVGRGDDPSA